MCCGGRLREGADILDCGQAGLVGGGHLGLGWGRPSWIGGSHLGLGVDMLCGGSHLGLRRTSRIGSTHLGLGPRWVGGGHLGLGRPYWGWRGHLGLGGGSGWGQPSWGGGSHLGLRAAILDWGRPRCLGGRVAFLWPFLPTFCPRSAIFQHLSPRFPPPFPPTPPFYARLLRICLFAAVFPLLRKPSRIHARFPMPFNGIFPFRAALSHFLPIFFHFPPLLPLFPLAQASPPPTRPRFHGNASPGRGGTASSRRQRAGNQWGHASPCAQSALGSTPANRRARRGGAANGEAGEAGRASRRRIASGGAAAILEGRVHRRRRRRLRRRRRGPR